MASLLDPAFINSTLTMIPYLDSDPFVHIVLSHPPIPSATVTYPYFSYLLSIIVSAPLVAMMSCFIISLISKEYYQFKSFEREMKLSMKAILLASPFIAFFLKYLFEQRIGFLMYDSDFGFCRSQPGESILCSSFYHFLLAPIGYMFFSDLYFYATHRLWHTPWIYQVSHQIHHTCRPSTTFAATAADAIEVFLSGHCATFFPALIIPIYAPLYLGLILATEMWTCFLHNNTSVKLPGNIFYDSHDHNIHHFYGQQNYNFSLFFKLWDKLLGTYKPEATLNVSFGGKKNVRG